jgi:hypothetical protein
MTLASRLSAAVLLWLAAGGLALAQDAAQAPIPFEGGSLTITETEDLDKVLAFNGDELARNYVVYFDKIVDLNGVKVALFAVGDGGNQCGPAEVMVWKPQGGDVETATVGEDCGAPPAAVTGNSIYFVPYLLPGESEAVQVWSPNTGLEVAGTITYAPQPGTGWQDLDPSKFENIIDSFKNEAVYDASKKLLGDKLTDVATGLSVGGSPETTDSGIFYASGCVPHACGSADAFMAVDPHGQKLYFAQEGDNPEPSAWPELNSWPAEVQEAMKSSMGQQ